MAIHESKNTHLETLVSRPSDDIIYYAYACIVARNLNWRPQNIANADEIYHFVNRLNNRDFFILLNTYTESKNFNSLSSTISNMEKWKILESQLKLIKSNQLQSSLLKNDARTIFLIWESAKVFKKIDLVTNRTEYEKYFPRQENGLFNDMTSIFLWLRRFEVYLCVNQTYPNWLIYLKYAFDQRGKRLTALDDIETEIHLKSIYGTLGRLIQNYDMHLVPPNYFNYFSIEDSVAIIQAWLDCQTEQTRAVIQPKLQQAIKQLVFREKQKKADKVPINSHLPAETMDAFKKFRAERGLTKEEALNFLILNGLTK